MERIVLKLVSDVKKVKDTQNKVKNFREKYLEINDNNNVNDGNSFVSDKVKKEILENADIYENYFSKFSLDDNEKSGIEESRSKFIEAINKLPQHIRNDVQTEHNKFVKKEKENEKDKLLNEIADNNEIHEINGFKKYG